MNRAYIPLIALAAAIAAGCGHTNNLAKYNVAGHTAYYRTSTAGDAAGSFAWISSPSDNLVAQAVTAVGSEIVGDQARRKLERAVNRDSIAHSVERGMVQATSDYLMLKPVESMEQNP